MTPPSRIRFGRLAALVLLGGVTALAGTAAHRALLPWGAVLALAAVLAAGVLARAFSGFSGLVAYGVGWIAVVEMLRRVGPGGDVLVAAQPVGYVWIFGGMAAVAAAAFAPERWFREQQRGSDRVRLDGGIEVGVMTNEEEHLDG